MLYYDREGALREQRAGAVVLACNGVGTPRLLLNSRSRLFPDGLANRSGMVGTGLMCHPASYAIGWFDDRGDCDLAVAIRLLLTKGDRVFIQAGAGIVYDSVPEAELEESISKARAMVRALEMAQGARR